MLKYQSFFEVFRPFVVVSNFLGINLFSLPQSCHLNSKIILERSNYITFLLITIVQIGVYTIQLTSPLNMKGYSTLGFILTIWSGVNALLTCFIDLKNRQNVSFILTGLNNIDCVVNGWTSQWLNNKMANSMWTMFFNFSLVAWAHFPRIIENVIRS